MTTQTNAARTQKSPQKSNQQKNGVRFVLATAATIVTLFGAQTLAFAGKATTTQSSTAAQVQSAQVTDTTGQSSQDTTDATDTTASTTTNNQTVQDNTTTTQITQAVAQPNPRSKSSR